MARPVVAARVTQSSATLQKQTAEAACSCPGEERSPDKHQQSRSWQTSPRLPQRISSVEARRTRNKNEPVIPLARTGANPLRAEGGSERVRGRPSVHHSPSSSLVFETKNLNAAARMSSSVMHWSSCARCRRRRNQAQFLQRARCRLRTGACWLVGMVRVVGALGDLVGARWRAQQKARAIATLARTCLDAYSALVCMFSVLSRQTTPGHSPVRV
jgi:hypothetical protein